MSGILCRCKPCGGFEDVENETCSLKPGGQCFSSIQQDYNKEEGVFEVVRSFGCISEPDSALLQCKGDLVQSKNLRSIKCCNFTDMCNENLIVELKPYTNAKEPISFIENNLVFLLSLTAVCVAFVFLIIYTLCFCYKLQQKKAYRKCLTEPFNIKLHKSQNMIHDFLSSTGSGSGAGKPLLIQTTISRQIKRCYCLGRGRFTEVYVGEWNAAKIVEKVFNTNEEERWAQEKMIYETATLQHRNILGYISADILPSGLRAIYLDYHSLGSLHDYLDKTSLNASDFLKLAETATAGIAHLHTEVLGASKLPPVVHRDITSKNFFISVNKECVISNFEIAIMPINSNDDTVVEPDLTQGTPRYMAPEIVSGTIRSDSFEAFRMADVYALGLVLYEICQRCATAEGNRCTVDEHTVPFFDVLPKNPTINDVKVLFETKKLKDDLLAIPPRWENDAKTLKPFSQFLRECFYENPKARPNVIRLKKSIISLHHYCYEQMSGR